MNCTCGIERGLEFLNSCLSYWAAQSDGECRVQGAKPSALLGWSQPPCPPQASHRHMPIHTVCETLCDFPLEKYLGDPLW